MVNKKAILKVFLVVFLVAVILIAAIAIFKETNEGNNKQVANTTLSLNDSENSKNLNKSVTSAINQSPTIAYFEEFQEHIKTSDPVLYNKCRLTHLQYIIQSTALKDLSVYSAFGSKDATLRDIDAKLNSYAEKLEKTYEAVAIFNQDYVIVATSQSAKEGEIARVAELLDEQNKLLFEANSLLLDYVVQFCFSDANVAKSDLNIVLFDALLKQSTVLQDQINNLYTKNEVGENLQVVFDDSTKAVKAYAVASKKAFVYGEINYFVSDLNITAEKFIELYNSTNNVSDMLKSENKATYIAAVEDAETKQALQHIWDFIVKLSTGGL